MLILEEPLLFELDNLPKAKELSILVLCLSVKKTTFHLVPVSNITLN